MTSCIKCGGTSEHSICLGCADALLDSYSPEDQVAFALLGHDVLRDRLAGIMRPKGNLAQRLEEHKKNIFKRVRSKIK